MKVGLRTRSYKKSFSAQTKGRYTRMKNSIGNPFYGKKNIGLFKDPAKYMKGIIYRRTTFGLSSVRVSKVYLREQEKKREKRAKEKAQRAEQAITEQFYKTLAEQVRREQIAEAKRHKQQLLDEENTLRHKLGQKYHL